MFEKAYEFAKAAHESINQTRKYTGEPYMVHIDDVIKILRDAGIDDDTILSAAALHDVVEDVGPPNAEYEGPYSLAQICRNFGVNIAFVVFELTNQFTSNYYPSLNRKARKQLETERLKQFSYDAKLIKLADIISNTKGLATLDPDFAAVYLREKQDAISAIWFFGAAEPKLDRLSKLASKQILSELAKLPLDKTAVIR